MFRSKRPACPVSPSGMKNEEEWIVKRMNVYFQGSLHYNIQKCNDTRIHYTSIATRAKKKTFIICGDDETKQTFLSRMVVQSGSKWSRAKIGQPKKRKALWAT